jgi:hypothetical protein
LRFTHPELEFAAERNDSKRRAAECAISSPRMAHEPQIPRSQIRAVFVLPMGLSPTANNPSGAEAAPHHTETPASHGSGPSSNTALPVSNIPAGRIGVVVRTQLSIPAAFLLLARRTHSTRQFRPPNAPSELPNFLPNLAPSKSVVIPPLLVVAISASRRDEQTGTR